MNLRCRRRAPYLTSRLDALLSRHIVALKSTTTSSLETAPSPACALSLSRPGVFWRLRAPPLVRDSGDLPPELWLLIALGFVDLLGDPGDLGADEKRSGLANSYASLAAELSSLRAALCDLCSSFTWVSSRHSRSCACTSCTEINSPRSVGARWGGERGGRRETKVRRFLVFRLVSRKYNVFVAKATVVHCGGTYEVLQVIV